MGIRNNKKLSVNRPKTGKNNFTNFSGGLNKKISEYILPNRYSSLCYNFKSSSGALKDGFGVKEWFLPTENGFKAVKLGSGKFPLKMYYYKKHDFDNNISDDRILAYANDKNMYELKLYGLNSQFVLCESLNFDSPPKAINYRYNNEDVLLLTDKTSNLNIYNGLESSVVESSPKITSMCIHYERLFVTTANEKTSLFFSDDFDVANWNVSLDEGGFIDLIDMSGELLKVVSFLDYLYVFRSHGISRITAFSDQSQFNVNSLFISSGKIFGETVSVCGDRIFFLSEDGLYEFDGVSTRNVISQINEIFVGVDNLDAQAQYKSGKYFLMANMNFDGLIKKRLLVFDFAENSFHIVNDSNISSLVNVIGDDLSILLVGVANDERIGVLTENGSIFEKPLRKIYASPKNDLGNNKLKLLKEISLISKSDITIKVITETEEKTFNIQGKNTFQNIKTNIKCRMVYFIIESESCQNEVSCVNLAYDLLE